MKKVLLSLFVLIILIGCSVPFTGRSNNKEKYEITEIDIVSIIRNEEELSSDQITILGIKLGDSEEEVEKKIGKPDIRNTDYQLDNIINLEYSSQLGLNGTGIIIHLEDSEVTRMTILKPFNEKLVGLTKLGKSKEEIYAYFGKPDSIDRMVKGSRVEFKTFVYTNGIEVLLKSGKEEDRLSFVKQSA